MYTYIHMLVAPRPGGADGAATAVLALARGRTLCVANLGDSGVRLLRDGKVRRAAARRWRRAQIHTHDHAHLARTRT